MQHENDEIALNPKSVKNNSASLHSGSLAPLQQYGLQAGPSRQFSSLPPSSPLPSSPKALCSDGDARSNDDPFGFLATERKLKQNRPRMVLQPKRIDRNISWASQLSLPKNRKPETVTSDRSESDSGREAFATPKHRKNTNLSASDDGMSLLQGQTESTLQGWNKRDRKVVNPGVSSSSSPRKNEAEKASFEQKRSELAGTAILDAVHDELSGEDAAECTTAKNGSESHSALTMDELLERLPHRPAQCRVPGRKKAKKNDRSKSQNKRIKRRRIGNTDSRPTVSELDGEVLNEREGESFVLDDEEREASSFCRLSIATLSYILYRSTLPKERHDANISRT